MADAEPTGTVTSSDADLVLLRDGFGALGVFLLLCQSYGTPQWEWEGDALATHVVEALAAQLVVPLAAGVLRVGGPVVCLGHYDGRRVFIAFPSSGRVFADGTLLWGRMAQTELARQYAGRCEIARLQTIGGGWASLRRADKALECALELYDVAIAVFDEETVHKCRLFIGWAQLWNGNTEAAEHLFQLELRQAVLDGDVVHQRRCQHALINAATNPTLRDPTKRGRFTLTDCWTRVFAGDGMENVMPL